ncbi:ABC transporter permease [Paenibacillus sp. FSL H8-0537]|uniref:ABC transporter permease n=1 Tax=Paenibacillus sp. FSL H8-0537 TaxID=2921399 RepID=UPI003101AC9A
MRVSDLTRLSWDQVRRRKVVTMLCAAGLSIGCAAIILAMSIGESTQKIVETQLTSYLKMDEITVMPDNGASAGPGSQSTASDEVKNRGKLSEQKVEIMRNIKHVKAVAAMQQLNYMQMVTSDDKQAYAQIIGTDLNSLEAFGNTYWQGSASDAPNSVVLSYGTTLGLMNQEEQNKLFEAMNLNPSDPALQEQYNTMMITPSALYQNQIQLVNYDQDNKQKISEGLRVVGVLKKPKGVSDIQIANDRKIYVSIETANKLREQLMQSSGEETANDTYNQVTVKVDAEENVKQVEEQIKKLTLNTQSNLLQKERLEEQFAVFKSIAVGAGVFILIIASISIIVAMTMSTYQRRRQIGIMKVLGANLAQIRNMFIVEAALLGLLGGLLGVLFSYWIVWGINALILSMSTGEENMSIFIPLTAIPVGLAFAVMTGIISGIYPAVSASRTDALTAIKRD